MDRNRILEYLTWGGLTSRISAWGLEHEHQKPSLWTPAFGGTGSVNAFIFTCTNLADYQATLTRVGADGMNRACTRQPAAKGAGFSANQILPFSGAGPALTVGQEFDTKSIMLYPSRIGGIPSNPPSADGRAIVYTLADGSEVPKNTSPSPLDVAALRQLYPLSSQQNQICLLWQNCSPFQTMFAQAVGCPVGSILKNKRDSWHRTLRRDRGF